jgi:hypothetical protein
MSGRVRNVASTVVPPAVVIPTALLVGVTVLYRFHRVWRWIRVGSLWANPNNFLQLAAGAGVDYLFGDKVPLRVAALMIWIPSRVADSIDEYNKLGSAWKKWKEAWRGDYPRSPQVHWVTNSKGKSNSPSFELFWKELGVVWRIRVWRVTVRSYKLGKRMFMLSMRSVDAFEALSLKKSSCDRAVSELFLDGTNVLDRIARKKEVVQEKLENNRPVVNKFLRKLGVKCTVNRLFGFLSSTMEMIGKLDNGVKKVSGIGGGMVKDLGKHVIFHAFSILDMPEKIPAKFLPGKWEEQCFEVKPSEQYVPFSWLMQPTKAHFYPKKGDYTQQVNIRVRRKPTGAMRLISENSLIRLVFVQD